MHADKPFLHYDSSWLSSFYKTSSNKENMLRSNDKISVAPYEVLFDYRKHCLPDWGICRYVGEYQLPNELIPIKERTLAFFHNNGLLYKGDNTCPRLKNCIVENGKLILYIEKASYYDQVATNLSLDYPLNGQESALLGANTLREWDMVQSDTPKDNLPTLESSKLANTIGVALGVIVKNKQGEKIFLTRQRTSTVAVAANKHVLPFSFSLNFEPSDFTIGQEKSFFELIKPDFINEQAEELGIESDLFNFENVKPLALCRELCRGGKPQLFCEIELNICFEEITKRITENILPQKEFTNTLQRFTLLKAQNAFDTLSPEMKGFVALKGE
ncbi:MAG: hypothetical protein KA397_02140 [Paludibacteraceae bacterium]|nr:hypothetical protein [Paludibacteraceae bacterium]